MMTFEIENHYDDVLRLILEPESSHYDLPPNEKVTVEISGDSPSFASYHSIYPGEGINCISFWSNEGQYRILYNGRNLMDIICEKTDEDVD